MSITDFVHKLQWEDIPKAIQHESKRVLLDTLGAAIIGKDTKISHIMYDYALATYGGKGAFLWFDGREVSPVAAALANGMTTNALGIYGGHPIAKGTVGGAILSSLFAIAPTHITGKELLTTWVIGIEAALRSGIAIHRTADHTYTACTWNILGATAMAARQLKLTPIQTNHAFGIAEYTAPIAPIHRTVAHPTMLRTGEGWSSMLGISAALLAKRDFEGIPALLQEEEEVKNIWADVGEYWQLSKYYYKPYAVCRWMQASLDAALLLRAQLKNNLESISRIKVHSFAVATNKMSTRFPKNIEEAQFSLKFGVAAILVYGELGKPSTFYDAFKDPLVSQLYERIVTIEEPKFTALYPTKRFAHVNIEMRNGQIHSSDDVEEKWASTDPPLDEELKSKFQWLTKGFLRPKRLEQLEQLIWNCEDLQDINKLIELIKQPRIK